MAVGGCVCVGGEGERGGWGGEGEKGGEEGGSTKLVRNCGFQGSDRQR